MNDKQLNALVVESIKVAIELGCITRYKDSHTYFGYYDEQNDSVRMYNKLSDSEKTKLYDDMIDKLQSSSVFYELILDGADTRDIYYYVQHSILSCDHVCSEFVDKTIPDHNIITTKLTRSERVDYSRQYLREIIDSLTEEQQLFMKTLSYGFNFNKLESPMLTDLKLRKILTDFTIETKRKRGLTDGN